MKIEIVLTPIWRVYASSQKFIIYVSVKNTYRNWSPRLMNELGFSSQYVKNERSLITHFPETSNLEENASKIFLNF